MDIRLARGISEIQHADAGARILPYNQRHSGVGWETYD